MQLEVLIRQQGSDDIEEWLCDAFWSVNHGQKILDLIDLVSIRVGDGRGSRFSTVKTTPITASRQAWRLVPPRGRGMR
ncbi:hypothetical protein Ahu01nite_079110 [Winogradskya humida]|uniref:Type II toxin-antitoxin system RelE/ParE family toxin n=1 Tax=Winogradskya humida TaxID=113566 RepID=A0ABQ4A1S2_9ACTN|nr:hypothetical protein Ahu01nite_079110 [Actinoplanes humidus]